MDMTTHNIQVVFLFSVYYDLELLCCYLVWTEIVQGRLILLIICLHNTSQEVDINCMFICESSLIVVQGRSHV